jgi:glycosyltransferase involved in cell wall biosynthesis
MKKNLIIFNPSIEDGGVEKNLFIIANYLASKNYNITVISADIIKKKKFVRNINFKHPKNVNFNNSGRYKKYFFCLIILVFELLSNNQKIVFSFQANIYAIIITKILFRKIIVRLNTAPQGWDHNFIKSRIYKFFINKADGIIVNSKKFKNEVKQRYKINSFLINNPFDFKKIKKLANQNIKYKFPKNKLKLINIGRMTDQKDQILILKAINLIKNKIKVFLLIIGKGKNKSKLKNYIKKNKLEKNVKLMNYQSNPYKFIKKSDLFILSSKYEGSPNVLIEALFLQKSIISTDCPTGPDEILKSGKYGQMFKVGDFKKLSKLILSFKKKKKIIPKNYFNSYKMENSCKKYSKFLNDFYKYD